MAWPEKTSGCSAGISIASQFFQLPAIMEIASISPASEYRVRLADLQLPEDQSAIVRLLDHYAQQPFGMAQSLPPEVQAKLIDGLTQRDNTRIFLAQPPEGPAIGLAVCFLGFSTFRALPLINIHDLVVHEDTRGVGVGGKLIDAVVQYAGQNGLCAVTLEVRQDNPARELYARKGFRNLQSHDPDGLMLFGKLTLVADPK